MYNLASNIPYHLLDDMEFYPDVILFKLSQFEFSQYWQQLSNSKYLYAQSSEIKTTNWLIYSLQTIKGWLGFENFCHPKRITYCLDKLAYYGYTQGYFSDAGIKNLKSYPLSFNIISLAAQKYNSQTTEQFQNALITSYLLSRESLPEPVSISSSYYKPRFGQSWLDINVPEAVPLLDPQNSELISDVIKKLESLGKSRVEYIKDSKFALQAAEFYIDQVNQLSNKSDSMSKQGFIYGLFSTLQESLSNVWQRNSKSLQENDPRLLLLEKALYFNPTLDEKYPAICIDFYLWKKQYKKVLNLLSLLEDPKLILDRLLLIPEAIRNSTVVKDSKIAAILAQHYLTKNQFDFAQAIFTNIEELDPAKAFTAAVKNKKYEESYRLYTRFKDQVIFSDEECKYLAKIYIDKGEELYKLGKECRDKKEWAKCVPFYCDSYLQKKAAHSLDPSKENAEELQTHRRLYAQVLVDSDTDLFKPECSNILSIQKAINLLKKCNPDDEEEQRYHQLALVSALMRRVDTLVEKLALPADVSSDHVFISQYKKSHDSEFSALIKTLKELISILKGTKEPSLKRLLGKSYFLLADTADYFSIEDSDINIKQNYRYAAETVSENPFYNLRVSEVLESEKDTFRDLAYRTMDQLGLNALDYLHWFDERWIKREQTIYQIKDIHKLVDLESTASKSRLTW